MNFPAAESLPPDDSVSSSSIPVEPLDPELLASVLTALTDRLTQTEEILAQLVDGLTEDNPGGPWVWHLLDGDQQRELFAELREWVDWLIERYAVQSEQYRIEPCWYRHSVAVEELTALMVAYRAEYSPSQRKASAGLISWHTMWLWPCLARLNSMGIFAACRRDRQHVESRIEIRTTDDADFANFLTTGIAQAGPAQLSPEVLARPLTAAQVTEFVASNHAQRMFADDLTGPIRIDHEWYAIPADAPDQCWRAVTSEQAAELESLAARVAEAHSADAP